VLEKRRRQTALLRVVRDHAAGSQRELIRFLRKAGFSATQASVSRDLRELGLVKVNGRYQHLPRPGRIGQAAPGGPFHELITSMEPIGANLVLVRTRVGAAPAVAIEIDARHADEIAGTLAGDDTILVVVRSRAAQGRAVVLLQRLRGAP
jgi:transcriptional regulator of arginine metabolism